jgi:P27 family predicted phage terminase small subunit
MPGRRQKPAELLQGKGSRHTGSQSLTLVADPTRPIPLPPSGLRKSARDAWLAFWRSDMAALVKDESDMDALRDWALCLSERDRLRVIVKRHPLVQTTKGTLMENPVARLISRYTAQISRYQDQFGLTPLSRLRLGIALGAAAETLAALDASIDDAPEWVDLEPAGAIEVGS